MKRLVIAVMVLAFALVLGGDRAVMAQTPGGERTIYDPPDKDAGDYTKMVIDDSKGHIVSRDDYRNNRLTKHTIYEDGKPVHDEIYRYDNGNKEILSFSDYSYYPNGNLKEMTRHTSNDDRKEDELRQFNEDGLETYEKKETTLKDGSTRTYEVNWYYDNKKRLYDRKNLRFEGSKQTDGTRVVYEYQGDNQSPSKTFTETWDPQKQSWSPPVEKSLETPPPPKAPVPETPGLKKTDVGFTLDPSFYVGLYGGPTFGNVSPNNPTFSNRAVDDNILTTITGNFTSHSTTSTNLTGGLKLGAWGGYPSLPAWTKYVGVYADFSYQNINLQRQTGYFMQTATAQGFEPTISGGVAGLSSANGNFTTVGLMFTGRYGFFPNPEVSSFGQLQPYLGVGPVLGIASLAPTFTFIKFCNLYGQQVNIPINETHKFSSQTSVFPALGVEAGLRYLPYRNVYLDVSYRYLYGKPSFSFTDANFQLHLNPTYNNHSLRFGVGLMF